MDDLTGPPTTPTDATTLRELVEAIDRREPHADRPEEAGIARDADVLKTEALRRLTELDS